MTAIPDNFISQASSLEELFLACAQQLLDVQETTEAYLSGVAATTIIKKYTPMISVLSYNAMTGLCSVTAMIPCGSSLDNSGNVVLQAQDMVEYY